MNNVSFELDQYGNKHAIINRGNGEYTSMPKAVYDSLQNKEGI